MGREPLYGSLPIASYYQKVFIPPIPPVLRGGKSPDKSRVGTQGKPLTPRTEDTPHAKGNRFPVHTFPR